MRDCMFLSP